jgi:nucleoside-diphosphate-sugar epimerase
VNQRETIAILGCGWLGSALGIQLVAAGHRVHGSTRGSERTAELRAAGIVPFRIDLDPTWRGDSPEAFFAAGVLVIALPPGRRQPERLSAYPRKMEAIGQCLAGTPVDRVLFVSSTSVYPDVGREVVEEEAGTGALTDSGRAVWEAEQRVQAFRGVRTTIVRMAGLYGYERHPGRFLARRAEAGSGAAPVNLIHRDDAVGVLLAVIEQGAWGRVYSACADTHPDRRTFYAHQARRLGNPEPAFSDVADSSFKIVSNRRLREELGCVFRYPDPLLDAP